MKDKTSGTKSADTLKQNVNDRIASGENEASQKGRNDPYAGNSLFVGTTCYLEHYRPWSSTSIVAFDRQGMTSY